MVFIFCVCGYNLNTNFLGSISIYQKSYLTCTYDWSTFGLSKSVKFPKCGSTHKNVRITIFVCSCVPLRHSPKRNFFCKFMKKKIYLKMTNAKYLKPCTNQK